jgi:hypothetical protein
VSFFHKILNHASPIPKMIGQDQQNHSVSPLKMGIEAPLKPRGQSQEVSSLPRASFVLPLVFKEETRRGDRDALVFLSGAGSSGNVSLNDELEIQRRTLNSEYEILVRTRDGCARGSTAWDHCDKLCKTNRRKCAEITRKIIALIGNKKSR